jgi:hypothetical protein
MRATRRDDKRDGSENDLGRYALPHQRGHILPAPALLCERRTADLARPVNRPLRGRQLRRRCARSHAWSPSRRTGRIPDRLVQRSALCIPPVRSLAGLRLLEARRPQRRVDPRLPRDPSTDPQRAGFCAHPSPAQNARSGAVMRAPRGTRKPSLRGLRHPIVDRHAAPRSEICTAAEATSVERDRGSDRSEDAEVLRTPLLAEASPTHHSAHDSEQDDQNVKR